MKIPHRCGLQSVADLPNGISVGESASVHCGPKWSIRSGAFFHTMYVHWEKSTALDGLEILSRQLKFDQSSQFDSVGLYWAQLGAQILLQGLFFFLNKQGLCRYDGCKV